MILKSFLLSGQQTSVNESDIGTLRVLVKLLLVVYTVKLLLGIFFYFLIIMFKIY